MILKIRLNHTFWTKIKCTTNTERQVNSNPNPTYNWNILTLNFSTIVDRQYFLEKTYLVCERKENKSSSASRLKSSLPSGIIWELSKEFVSVPIGTSAPKAPVHSDRNWSQTKVVYETMSRIDTELTKLSNTKAKSLLKIIATKYGMQLSPMESRRKPILKANTRRAAYKQDTVGSKESSYEDYIHSQGSKHNWIWK